MVTQIFSSSLILCNIKNTESHNLTACPPLAFTQPNPPFKHGPSLTEACSAVGNMPRVNQIKWGTFPFLNQHLMKFKIREGAGGGLKSNFSASYFPKKSAPD